MEIPDLFMVFSDRFERWQSPVETPIYIGALFTRKKKWAGSYCHITDAFKSRPPL